MHFARKLIVHYHLFKNAGTSVDANLRRMFAEEFLEIEFGGPADIFGPDRLIQLFEEKQQICAVSSHTLGLPVPHRDNWLIFPIIFLRHPLDRIQSMYRYENMQKSDSPGARLAKKHNFADYVKARLSSPDDIVIRNWQVRWLARGMADFNSHSYADEKMYEMARIVTEQLPFLGAVERFPESLSVLNQAFSDQGISVDFKVEEKNRSPIMGETLSERLRVFRLLLGEQLYEELRQANSMDIRLNELAISAIDSLFADQCKQNNSPL